MAQDPKDLKARIDALVATAKPVEPAMSPLEERALAEEIHNRLGGLGVDLGEFEWGTESERFTARRKREAMAFPREAVRGAAQLGTGALQGLMEGIDALLGSAKSSSMQSMADEYAELANREVAGEVLEPKDVRRKAWLKDRMARLKEEMLHSQGVMEDVTRLTGDVDAWVDRQFELSEEVQAFAPKQTFVEEVLGAVAGMAAPIGAAAITRSPGVGYGSFMAQGGARMTADALRSGADVDTARQAYSYGAALGATEMLPLSRGLARLGRMGGAVGRKKLRDKVVAVLAQGGEEAIQEGVIQTPLEKVVAQHILEYADKEDFATYLKDSFHAGTVGGVVGLLFGAGSVGGARAVDSISQRSQQRIADKFLLDQEGDAVTLLFREADRLADQGGSAKEVRALLSEAYRRADEGAIQARQYQLELLGEMAAENQDADLAGRIEGELEVAAGVVLKRGRELYKEGAEKGLEAAAAEPRQAEETGNVEAEMRARNIRTLEAQLAQVNGEIDDGATLEENTRRAFLQSRIKERIEAAKTAKFRPLGEVAEGAEVTPAEQAVMDAVALLRERGLDVPDIMVMVTPERLPIQGAYQDGRLVVQVAERATDVGTGFAVDPARLAKSILFHELLHANARVGSANFKALAAAVREASPEFARAMRDHYVANHRSQTGEDPLPGLKRRSESAWEAAMFEEGLANAAEQMPGVIELLLSDPDALAQALQKNPGFFEWLRDLFARILARLGQGDVTEHRATRRRKALMEKAEYAPSKMTTKEEAQLAALNDLLALPDGPGLSVDESVEAAKAIVKAYKVIGKFEVEQQLLLENAEMKRARAKREDAQARLDEGGDPGPTMVWDKKAGEWVERRSPGRYDPEAIPAGPGQARGQTEEVSPTEEVEPASEPQEGASKRGQIRKGLSVQSVEEQTPKQRRREARRRKRLRERIAKLPEGSRERLALERELGALDPYRGQRRAEETEAQAMQREAREEAGRKVRRPAEQPVAEAAPAPGVTAASGEEVAAEVSAPAPEVAPSEAPAGVNKPLAVAESSYTLDPSDRRDGYQLYLVDPDVMDAELARDRTRYVGPLGTGQAIGDRYERFRAWVIGAPFKGAPGRRIGQLIEAATVGYSDGGMIFVDNGRHRLAALRDMGVPVVVAMRATDAVRAKEAGIVTREVPDAGQRVAEAPEPQQVEDPAGVEALPELGREVYDDMVAQGMDPAEALAEVEEMLAEDDKYGERPLKEMRKEGEYEPPQTDRFSVAAGEMFDPRDARETQQYPSDTTSRNQVPASFKAVEWRPGTINLDHGGGAYDKGTEYLAEKGVTNLVYDPFNRGRIHNRVVLARARGGVDTVTLANVLNVIRERGVRHRVLREAAAFLKPGGEVYIQVHEKDGTGEGAVSRDGVSWQENRKLDTYIPEVKEVFGEVERKGKVLIAKSPLEAQDADEAALLMQAEQAVGMKRHPEYGVGKLIGGDLYVEKSHMDRLPQKVQRIARRLAEQMPDYDYKVVKWNEREGTVSFIQSPDFDTAQEPLVTASVKHTPGKGFGKQTKHSNVYHHKWLFVAPDYAGFDVGESYQRTLDVVDMIERGDKKPSQLGTKRAWDEFTASAPDRFSVGAEGLADAKRIALEAERAPSDGPKIRVMFHSSSQVSAEELHDGLYPELGDWVREVYAGATDDPDFDVDEQFIGGLFLSDAPTWVGVQVARKLGKDLADVTEADIREHGTLAVISNLDPDGDPAYEVYRATDGGYQKVEDAMGREMDLWQTPLYEEGLWGGAREVAGMEDGDIVTVDSVEPDAVLSGQHLLDFMEWWRDRYGADGSPNPDDRASRFSVAQTSTPEFRRWFGNSKVVDAEGRPLVVYHGTAKAHGATVFRSRKFANVAGYFAEDPAVAGIATSTVGMGREGDRGNIYPVYLSLQNPVDISHLDGAEPISIEDFARQMPFDVTAAEMERFRADVTGRGYRDVMPPWSHLGGDFWRDLMRRNGHDGVIYQEFNPEALNEILEPGEDAVRTSRSFIAFRPDQIKSATGNVGAFGQRPVTEAEAAPLGMTAAEANEAQARGDIRFSVAPVDQLGFFSNTEDAFERMVAKSGAKKVKRDLVLSKLLAAGGNKEEVAWMGLEEWAKAHPEPRIPVDELREFIRENAVVVGEKVLRAPAELPKIPEGVKNELARIRRELDALEGPLAYGIDGVPWESGSDPRRMELFRKRDELQRRYHELYDPIERAQDEARNAPQPRYADYQLPGGENYRELLLTLPVQTVDNTREREVRVKVYLNDGHSGLQTIMSQDRIAQARADGHRVDVLDRINVGAYEGGHYGDTPNVLAHVRFNERTLPSGERVLFIEEIQSDWHQAGREDGYALPMFRVVSATGGPVLKRGGQGRADFDTRAEAEAYADSGPDGWSVKEIQGPGVPDAPFKQGWEKLAMRRMVRWAAENGFDRVAWTTGVQQVERYATSYRKAVQRIEWGPTVNGEPGSVDVDIHTPDGGVLEPEVSAQGVVRSAMPELDGKRIEEVVGKEIAGRIMSEPRGKAEGDDLTIGGEGMKAAYDRRLVGIANKLGKAFGAKVGRVTLPLGDPVHSLPVTDAMRDSVTTHGQPRFSVSAFHGSPHDIEGGFSTDKIGTGEGEQAYGWGLYFADKKSVAQHYKGVDDDLLEIGAVEMDQSVGHGYTVRLAPADDEWLLWDRPLSEQSDKVKAALEPIYGAEIEALPDTELLAAFLRSNLAMMFPSISEVRAAKNAWREGGEMITLWAERQRREEGAAFNLFERSSGGVIYGREADRLGSQKAASLALLDAGIRGIKYLDGTSRSKGEGSFNYVVFDDADVEITDRWSVSASFDNEAIYAASAGPQEVPFVRMPSRVADMDGRPTEDSPFNRWWEPAGEYFHPVAAEPEAPEAPGQEFGTHRFRNALRLPVGRASGVDSWKRELSRMFGGLRGRDLSEAIVRLGYDGILTHEDGRPTEGVNLQTFDYDRARWSVAAESGLDGMAKAGELLDGSRQALKGFVQRNLTSRGDLPQSAFNAMLRRDFGVKVQNQRIKEANQDFKKAASEAYGGAMKMTAEELRAVDLVLKGQRPATSIPEPMREVTLRMRRHIDALSRQLLRDGVVEGETAATVSRNLGFYVTRSYRAFDDPKWAEKVPADVRNKAKALFREWYPDKTDEQLEDLIAVILYEGKAADSPIAMLKRGKLGSKDLSILTRRKEIPDEIRALLGEYEDPMVNYSRSVTKMAHLIANQRFLNQVKEAGLAEGFFAKEGTRVLKKKIAAEESDALSPLNGLYAAPELVDAFEETMNPEVMGALGRAWMTANGTAKMSKTVLSSMTHSRNLLGNGGFAMAQGHWRGNHFREAFMGTLTGLGAMKGPEWRSYYRDALQYGVIHESARAGELRDIVRDASGRNFDDATATLAAGRLARLGKKGLRGVTDLYQAEDDLWKLYAWENEKARYRKAKPEWTEDQVKAKAAEIVRNTYPTYSLVPRGIKWFRKSPIIGTFVSFPAEVYRTTGNTVALIRQEWADPDLRGIAAQRIVGSTLAATIPMGLAATSAFLLGISGDDDEAVREFQPGWTKYSDFLYYGRYDNGFPKHIDLGYTDPFSYIRQPIKALFSGESWEEGVMSGLLEVAEPFMSEEVFTRAVREVVSNKTQTGARVFNPADDFNARSLDIAMHIGKALEPGEFSGVRRIKKGFEGHVTSWGKEYDPWVEIASRFGAPRPIGGNIEQSLMFRIKDYGTGTQDANKILSSVASRAGTVSDSDIRSAYESAERARRRIFEEALKAVRAARQLDMDESTIRARLNAAGISAQAVQDLMDGEYRPYSPTGNFLQYYERGAADDRRDELRRRRRFVDDLSREARQ